MQPRWFPVAVLVGALGLLPAPAGVSETTPASTEPSAAAAATDVLATLRAGHPRLLATAKDWEKLRARRDADPDFAAVVRVIDAQARQLLRTKPETYRKTGRRLLAVSRSVLQRELTLGFAFRLSGERAFAQRAEQELLAVAAFEDWNPSHFLDTAEMTAAVALGYDWLFDELSPETRATLRQAIVAKGLRVGLEPKGNGWQRGENNWNQVCFGGLTLGALAIADAEPELARQLLTLARAGNPHGLKPYAPDGVYPEGPSYWGYGTTYQVLMLAGLESALGTDWGLSASPGFLASAGAYLQTTGPTGALFNFADGREPGSLQPALFWFARRAHDPGLVSAQLAEFAPAPGDDRAMEARRETERFLALAALWWPAERVSGAPQLPRSFLGRGANPIAVFRSAWADPAALYLALKGGSASLNHAHMDAGSFVFEADGVRWARDLGMQEYESLESKGIDLWNKKQESPRWTVFRLNNRSHNTLTIDDQLHRVAGAAEITAFSEAPGNQFAVVELTPVFAGQAASVRRGFRVVGERAVLVQDELTGLRPGASVRWTMVTGAEVELRGASAVLRERGRTLEAKLLAPAGAEFAVIPADPPADNFNAPNPGRRVLSVTVVAGDDGKVQLALWLQPGSAAELAPPAVPPLREWANSANGPAERELAAPGRGRELDR